MKKLLFILCCCIATSSFVYSQVTPTNEWISLWSDSCKINHALIPVGSIIRAYDPQGVQCGEYTVNVEGSYGLMPVYRDDSTTPADEGALPGDTITFTINAKAAFIKGNTNAIWTSNGDIKKIRLAMEEPLIEIAPTALLFRAVQLHNSVKVSMSVTNTGLKQLVVDSIISKYHFPEFVSFSISSVTLDPGKTANIDVTFAPHLGSDSVGGQLKIYSNAVNAAVTVVPFTAFIQSDIIPTNEWVSIWSDSSTFNKTLLQKGDVVDVYDPQGIHCGTYTVSTVGGYGLLPVYRDDTATPLVDEGASPMDTLSFRINGFKAFPVGPASPVWTSNGSVLKVNLKGASNHPPGAFKLISPASKAILDTSVTTPTFRWSKSFDPDVADTILYELMYSLNSNFTAATIKSVKDTSYTVPSAQRLLKNKKYYWRVRAIDTGHLFTYGSGSDTSAWTFSIGVVMSIPLISSGSPSAFLLHQNFPNPFNPATSIRFDIRTSTFVTLEVYNVLGQEIVVLVNEQKESGSYIAEWNAQNIPSGIYFYSLHAGDFTETKKMMLLK